MLCHASSLMGQSIIGLGNSSLDWETLANDFTAAEGIPHGIPFAFSNVRGTTEAAAVIAHFLQYRDAELKLRPKVELAFRTDCCEDTPAWWLLKKKKTAYHPGTHPAQSVRLHMSLGIHPLQLRTSSSKECEPTFAAIRAYVLSLEPPKYRLRGGRSQSRTRPRGSSPPTALQVSHRNLRPQLDVSQQGCRSQGNRHGSSTLAKGFTLYAESGLPNESWFRPRKRRRKANPCMHAPRPGTGEAARPWTASGRRPPISTTARCRRSTTCLIPRRGPKSSRARSRPTKRTTRRRQSRSGSSVELDRGADPKAPGMERRKIYDTTLPGRGNGGHTYGDALTEDERWAVIEYLKTL